MAELRVDRPQPGYYTVRLVKRGPPVPVRIAREITPDPDYPDNPMDRAAVLVVEVGGEIVDDATERHRIWEWCAGSAITREEYAYRMAEGEWCRAWAPDAPAANPRHALDVANEPPAF